MVIVLRHPLKKMWPEEAWMHSSLEWTDIRERGGRADQLDLELTGNGIWEVFERCLLSPAFLPNSGYKLGGMVGSAWFSSDAFVISQGRSKPTNSPQMLNFIIFFQPPPSHFESIQQKLAVWTSHVRYHGWYLGKWTKPTDQRKHRKELGLWPKLWRWWSRLTGVWKCCGAPVYRMDVNAWWKPDRRLGLVHKPGDSLSSTGKRETG